MSLLNGLGPFRPMCRAFWWRLPWKKGSRWVGCEASLNNGALICSLSKRRAEGDPRRTSQTFNSAYLTQIYVRRRDSIDKATLLSACTYFFHYHVTFSYSNGYCENDIHRPITGHVTISNNQTHQSKTLSVWVSFSHCGFRWTLCWQSLERFPRKCLWC